MTTKDRLGTFFRDESGRFSGADIDVRLGNLGQITGFLSYLEIAVRDYEQANASFFEHFEAWWRLQKSWGEGVVHQLTDDEVRTQERGSEINLVLHLRIETFYLFSKILLDKIGQAIEGYFGQAQGASLSRHSKLRKNIEEFAKQQGLSPVPQALSDRMAEVADRISDYRDHFVTHEQSPRTIKGTTFQFDTRTASISVGRINPGPGEVGIQAESPPTLLQLVETYVGEIIDYIAENRERSPGRAAASAAS